MLSRIIFTILSLVLVSIIILITPANSPKNQERSPSASVSLREAPLRKAAVAGSFYPSSKAELTNRIEGLLAKAGSGTEQGKLRILVVPHAGLEYSGGTAAEGFKQIEGEDYRRIIILGSSHRHSFRHAAVFAKGDWETPLGKVSVDEDLAHLIINQEEEIINDPKVHEGEHSLEMELIFLQKVLKEFKILPILVSDPSETLIDNLARRLSDNLDEGALLIVSTDLSHYPNYVDAYTADQKVIEAILSGDRKKLEETVKDVENGSYPKLDTAACGYQSLRVALTLSRLLDLKDFKKIDYKNSGDITGDKSRVVGYASIGVWSGSVSNLKIPTLNKEDEREALQIARATLEEYLKRGRVPEISTQSEGLLAPLGAFVTLKKNGVLRGCIGEFEPKDPLYKIIQRMTVAAAIKDRRFSPVREDELRDITVEISVLTPKRRVVSWKEIQLGKHGVVVQKGSSSGTFLPQVAVDTGWSEEEFLRELCSQKAFLPSDCYKDPDASLYVFEARVFEEK